MTKVIVRLIGDQSIVQPLSMYFRMINQSKNVVKNKYTHSFTFFLFTMHCFFSKRSDMLNAVQIKH